MVGEEVDENEVQGPGLRFENLVMVRLQLARTLIGKLVKPNSRGGRNAVNDETIIKDLLKAVSPDNGNVNDEWVGSTVTFILSRLRDNFGAPVSGASSFYWRINVWVRLLISLATTSPAICFQHGGAGSFVNVFDRYFPVDLDEEGNTDNAPVLEKCQDGTMPFERHRCPLVYDILLDCKLSNCRFPAELHPLMGKWLQLARYQQSICKSATPHPALTFHGDNSLRQQAQENFASGRIYSPAFQRSRPVHLQYRGVSDRAYVDATCNKKVISNRHMTPGVIIVMCCHRYVYAVELMRRPEGPLQLFDLLYERLSDGDRTIIYDNACNLMDCAMRREPVFFEKTRWYIDRLHLSNHVATGCSEGHDMDLENHEQYSKTVSQMVEQLNAVVKKKGNLTIPHMSSSTAMIYLLEIIEEHNTSIAMKDPVVIQQAKDRYNEFLKSISSGEFDTADASVSMSDDSVSDDE